MRETSTRRRQERNRVRTRPGGVIGHLRFMAGERGRVKIGLIDLICVFCAAVCLTGPISR